jgi:hypothetical protein
MTGWAAEDELRGARERFTAMIPGWVQPAVHGLVTTIDGVTRVQVVSGLDHRLPAVILGSVIGRVSGTGTHDVTVEQLAEAARLLEPAEAALFCPHPNLWTWRRVLSEQPSRIQAVFIDDLSDPVSSEADALLRTGL